VSSIAAADADQTVIIGQVSQDEMHILPVEDDQS